MLPATSTEDTKKNSWIIKVLQDGHIYTMENIEENKKKDTIQILYWGHRQRIFPLTWEWIAATIQEWRRITASLQVLISSNTIFSRTFWKGSCDIQIKMGKAIAYKVLRINILKSY